jgi:hypothetical protein
MQSAAPTTGGIFVSGLSHVMDDGRRSSDALGQRPPERHGARYRAKCDRLPVYPRPWINAINARPRVTPQSHASHSGGIVPGNVEKEGAALLALSL